MLLYLTLFSTLILWVVADTRCSYQLRADAPQTLHCGSHGTFSHPAPLGKAQPQPSNLKCLDSCLSTASCVVYGYNKRSRTCQLYSKTINDMGLKKSPEHITVFYNKHCYEQVCTTICPTVPIYNSSEEQGYTRIHVSREYGDYEIVDPSGSFGDVNLVVESRRNTDPYNGQWVLIPQADNSVNIQNRVSGKFITAGSTAGSYLYLASPDGSSSQLFGYSLDRCRLFSVLTSYTRFYSEYTEDASVVMAPEGTQLQNGLIPVNFIFSDPEIPASYVTKTFTSTVTTSAHRTPTPTTSFQVMATDSPFLADNPDFNMLLGIPTTVDDGSNYAMSFDENHGGAQVTLAGFPNSDYLYTPDGSNILSMFVYGSQDPFPVTLAVPGDSLSVPLTCAINDTSQAISCSAQYSGNSYSNWVVGDDTVLTISMSADNATLLAVSP